MSHDADVRRLVRELLRTGLDVEQTLDLVLEELQASCADRILVRAEKTNWRRRIANDPAAPFVDDIEWKINAVSRHPMGVNPIVETTVETVTEESRLMPEAKPWVNTGNGAGDEFGGSDYP